jgi:hypothetical protein
MELLEPRIVPVLSWVDLYPGGTLIAYDDNTRGDIYAYHAAGSVFVRDDTNGGLLRSCPETAVTRVQLVGNGGNDRLRAATTLPCSMSYS